MLTNVFGFAILAGIGLNYRRRPEIHRPMMLLATLFAAGPAGLFRIPWISGPILATVHNIFAPWISMFVLGCLLVLIKWLMTKSWDRYFAAGLVGIAVACGLQYVVSSSAWWQRLAGLVTT